MSVMFMHSVAQTLCAIPYRHVYIPQLLSLFSPSSPLPLLSLSPSSLLSLQAVSTPRGGGGGLASSRSNRSFGHASNSSIRSTGSASGTRGGGSSGSSSGSGKVETTLSADQDVLVQSDVLGLDTLSEGGATRSRLGSPEGCGDQSVREVEEEGGDDHHDEWVEEEGLDEEDDEDEDERVRTQSEDVRHIIQEATTVFVNEWQLANENEDSGEDSYRHSEESYSDVEEEEEEVEAVKDKDA